MLTMATKGQTSVCFSCGQPLPRDLQPYAAPAAGTPGSDIPEVQAFPLTGALASPLEPPPNPYIDVRVGRDPAQCPITLNEPRVSAVHSTLRFENGQLMVRDEGSNNGTYVNGVRLPASVFTPVGSGAALRFGPVEFSVRLE